MQMHVIAYEPSADWAGPYTNQELLKRTLAIIQQVDRTAEVISKETDPWAEQILAGLLPYKIHVDLVDGMPQLPAAVSITWPPAQLEGIQIGSQEFREYFVWAKSEVAALRKLATLNKTPSAAKPAAATEEA